MKRGKNQAYLKSQYYSFTWWSHAFEINRIVCVFRWFARLCLLRVLSSVHPSCPPFKLRTGLCCIFEVVLVGKELLHGGPNSFSIVFLVCHFPRRAPAGGLTLRELIYWGALKGCIRRSIQRISAKTITLLSR